MLAAVGAYFVLNAVFTVWVWGVEAGVVFEGGRIGGESVCSLFIYIYTWVYMGFGFG